jgi:c-di-GMP-binding flagellar brake protein YcgR
MIAWLPNIRIPAMLPVAGLTFLRVKSIFILSSRKVVQPGMSGIPPVASKTGAFNKPAKRPNSFGIKMQSKTVVMNKDYVTTGVLTFAEGDIIEVEIEDLKSFALGDQVKTTIYSTGGIHVFETHVVAKNRGSLILLNPPDHQDKFAERREHPRVQVAEEGKVCAIIESPAKERKDLEEPLHLTVNNVSVSGIGFTLFENVELEKSTQLELEMELGSKLQVTVEIVRREKTEYGYYYGAQFINISPDKLISLRAYVLKRQVETYYRKKEQDTYDEVHFKS